MQRILLMMRHAKTHQAEPGQTDFDRTLTPRGKRNSTEMAERLKEQKLIPDLIIASPAKRTRQTAEGVAEILGYDKDKIKYADKLYHCTPSVFEEVIYETDDAAHTLMIIAHNPGITDFVNTLSPKFKTDDMPTAAIAATHVTAKHWIEFSIAHKEVFLYTYPKQEL